MSAILTKDLIYEILSAVEEIPEGKVATYGQIAKLIGREKNARLVGKVLSMSEYYGTYPCHRVVNHVGRLAPRFTQQENLLRGEGVSFKSGGLVDMAACRRECYMLPFPFPTAKHIPVPASFPSGSIPALHPHGT